MRELIPMQRLLKEIGTKLNLSFDKSDPVTGRKPPTWIFEDNLGVLDLVLTSGRVMIHPPRKKSQGLSTSDVRENDDYGSIGSKD